MALTQNGQTGEWSLTIRHDKPNVSIPATFTYDGVSKSFNITRTDQTIEHTGWFTPLCEPIDVDSIDMQFTPVEFEGKTYVVRYKNFEVIPYDSGSTQTTLELSWTNKNVSSAASTNGTLLHVSSNTSWTIAKPSGSFANVTVTAGTGNQDLRVTYSENTDTANSRTAVFTAKTTDDLVIKTFSITQAKASSGSSSGGVITHELVVTPSASTIDATGTTSLTATYYTLTDGVRDAGVDVTNDAGCAWSASSSAATVSAGVVTGNNTNRLANRNVSIKATYDSISGSAVVTVRKASEPITITYGLVIAADPDEISWNGTSQLSARYVTLANGTETNSVNAPATSVTWTITENSAYTNGISAQGVLTANNDTVYNDRTVKVKGAFSGCESEEVSIFVNRKDSTETRYELVITPSSTGISSAGTVQLTAEFLTYANGSTTPTNREDVTSSSTCTWTSNKTQAATVSGGLVVANNETYDEQLVTIRAEYNGYYRDASVVVAPKAGEAPRNYYVLVILPTAATLEYQEELQLTAKLYTYQSGNPTPVAESIVTSAVTWTSDNQYVGIGDLLNNKGMAHSYNYRSDVQVANITAEYTHDNVVYSAVSIITANALNINVTVDTTPVDSECSGDTTFTRHINADSGLSWKVEIVDVESLTGHPIDWVTVFPSSGVGSGDIVITLTKPNSGMTKRDCFVWVYYPAEGNLYREIQVNQYPAPRFNLSAQTLTMPQLGSTETVFVDTNYPIAYSNNGNTWLSLQDYSAATGYNLRITSSEASAVRSGTVTVTSEYSGNCATFNPVTLTVNQEYTPPVPPQANGKVFVASSSTGNLVDTLSYEIPAAAQNIDIFISTNAECHIVSCTPGLSVTETNNLELSGGTAISATTSASTGIGNRRRLIAHVPVNHDRGYGNDKTYSFRIETSDYSSSDLNYDDHVEITIHQAYCWYTDSGYSISITKIRDGYSDISAINDDITIGSSEHEIYPWIVVTADRNWTDGVSEHAEVSDYMVTNGVDYQILSMSASSALVEIVPDGAHEGSYIPETYKEPFKLYIPQYKTFPEDQHESARTFDLTFTYVGDYGRATKTIHLHQLWSAKPLEPVDMHLLSGSSPEVLVDSASATVTGNGIIKIQPNIDGLTVTGETNVTLRIGGEYGKFTVETGGMQYGANYDMGNANSKTIVLRNNPDNASGTHYSVTITCQKNQKQDKILLVNVTVQ